MGNINPHVKAVFDFIGEVYSCSDGMGSRLKTDFFADRLVMSGTAESLLSFSECLINVMGTQFGYITEPVATAFIKACKSDDSAGIYAFVRQNPKLVTMIVKNYKNKHEEYYEQLSYLDIPQLSDSKTGVVYGKDKLVWDMPIHVKLLDKMHHGADTKNGNASLFRTGLYGTDTNSVIELPFYSGNAVRGQLRDIIADQFLETLGLTPSDINPVISLWFFYVLYTGGILGEKDKPADKVAKGEKADKGSKGTIKKLGQNGATIADGMREFREMIPAVFVLGAAMGDRILNGQINVGELRPHCKEFGYEDKPNIHKLMAWHQLTRRDDFKANEESHAMIAVFQTLVSGVELSGGIDWNKDHVRSVERSCLGHALNGLIERGYIGACSRMGFGKCEINVGNIPDPSEYLAFQSENRDKILEYLHTIEADIANTEEGREAMRKARKIAKEGKNEGDTDSTISLL